MGDGLVVRILLVALLLVVEIVDDTNRRHSRQNNQLQITTSPIVDAVGDTSDNSQKFDLVSTSNIFDWAPMEKKANDIKAIAEKCLGKDGGIMMLRLGFGGGDDVIDACKDTLKANEDVSIDELASIERAPFFQKTPGGLVVLQHK